MIKKAWEKDKRKVKKLVEGNNFDYFILSLICIDAVALGFMTSDITNVFFDNVLFILDRLCMAIFIMEMLMKLYAYGKGFFKSGWNVFDLIVVAVSSVPFASYFIVLRTFRLFRSLKYVNKFSRSRLSIPLLRCCRFLWQCWRCLSSSFMFLQLWRSVCSAIFLLSLPRWVILYLRCCRSLRWTAGLPILPVRLCRYSRIPGCSSSPLSSSPS